MLCGTGVGTVVLTGRMVLQGEGVGSVGKPTEGEPPSLYFVRGLLGEIDKVLRPSPLAATRILYYQWY